VLSYGHESTRIVDWISEGTLTITSASRTWH